MGDLLLAGLLYKKEETACCAKVYRRARTAFACKLYLFLEPSFRSELLKRELTMLTDPVPRKGFVPWKVFYGEDSFSNWVKSHSLESHPFNLYMGERNNAYYTFEEVL